MDSSKLRVIIAEDDDFTLKVIQETVSRLGHEIVATCTSGEEVIDVAYQLKPDLILMDIMLEDIVDGIRACKEIKERSYARVIFLTAHNDDEISEEIEEIDHDGILVKPFEKEDLEKMISEAFKEEG